MIDLQEELIGDLGQPEMEWISQLPPAQLTERVEELARVRVAEAMSLEEKQERNQALGTVREYVLSELQGALDDDDASKDQVEDILRGIEKATMRRRILESGTRSDGRSPETIRELSCDVGLLPRTHGSALFTRGQTQALCVATLGTSRDEQRIDSIDVLQEVTKSFMLHYNFPPFCVGEARPIRGTSRREIGHGALAERAIRPLLPSDEDFPYTIRVVSDVLESNGSSSMATVCGTSMALMAAGVPVKAACAGVAMGLIKDGDQIVVLTDILGLEDALGDLDFKVAGTRSGVTAIQMDIKIDGVSAGILAEALERARDARLHILEVMDQTVDEPSGELSPHAPRITTIQVNPEKLGDIIGPKGKIIRAIQDETGAKIEVEDSGLVKIAAVAGESAIRARERIEAIIQEPEVGRIYEGPVKNTTTFGAFVEILPGVEGLCHISELERGRVERTEDVLTRGDITRVKLLAIDEKGRMRLSRRAALDEEGEKVGAASPA